MNSNNRTTSRSIQDLGRIALAAAGDLDNRISNPRASRKHIDTLAQYLKTLFPGTGRPLLPSDTIGLVCDIIETWNDGEPHTKDYKQPMRIARSIAAKLQQPNISKEESKRLISFCLALHGATRNLPSMHDIPEHHPYVLTFA